jgi:rubredoxin
LDVKKLSGQLKLLLEYFMGNNQESVESTDQIQVNNFENEGNVLHMELHKYKCSECDYVYNESTGDDHSELSAGTLWGEISSEWKCPICGCPKNKFHFLV